MKLVSVFQKILYLSVFLTCLIIFLVQVSRFIERYIERETSISLNVQRYYIFCNIFYKLNLMENIIESFRTQLTEFPSVTICPDYSIAYRRDVLAKFNTTVGEIRSLNFPNLSISTSRFFDLVTQNLTEILTSLTIKTLEKDNGSSFIKTTMYDENIPSIFKRSSISEHFKIIDDKEWITHVYLLFGRCYSYNIPIDLKRRGVYEELKKFVYN